VQCDYSSSQTEPSPGWAAGVAVGPPLLRGVAQSACGGAGSPPPKAQAAGCELHIDTDIIH